MASGSVPPECRCALLPLTLPDSSLGASAAASRRSDPHVRRDAHPLLEPLKDPRE
jgi:hypothetical protein